MLYEIDLSQAEPRIVANLAGDPTMLKAFSDPHVIANGGIHSLTAARYYGIDITEVSEEKGTSRLNPNRSQRDDGKTMNNAFNYGFGPNAFADRNDLPLGTAKQIHSFYLTKLYRNIKLVFWPYVEEQLKSRRAVTDLFGRVHEFRGRFDDMKLKAYPCIPQATVGHIIHRWGVLELMNDQVTYGPVDLLMQTHDSLHFQIDDRLGWKTHVKCLTALLNSLGKEPLRFEDREWAMPADLQAGYRAKPMTKLDRSGDLEEQLEHIKKKEQSL